MIVVVCLNPALDVTYHLDRFAVGEVHRARRATTRPGGKGTNVARVLGQLGHATTLIAPLGGAAGDQFARLADRVQLHAVPVRAATRSCVTVVADSIATVVNEPGLPIADAEWDRFVAAVHEVVVAGDVVVLSGSLPAGPSVTAYAELITTLTTATCLLDTSGEALIAALDARPDVVAPNVHEVRESTERPELCAADAARLLHRAGARAAVVSDGAAGLTLVTDDGVLSAAPPRTVAGNPTGAGDALTAALAAGLADGVPWRELVVDAVAVAAASVACPVAGELDEAVLQEFRGTR